MIKKRKFFDSEGNEIEEWSIEPPKIVFFRDPTKTFSIDMDNLETKLKKHIAQLNQEDFEAKLKKSKENPIEKLSDFTTEKVRELNLNILEDITEIKPENKDWVLKALGFKRINTYTWEHPWFADNKDKYLLFDIDKDDLTSLVIKIFGKGRDRFKETAGEFIEKLY